MDTHVLREGAPVAHESLPVFGFSAGMTKVVGTIARALVLGHKAPDFTDAGLLTRLQAAEHDVQVVLELLCRRKGHGVRVLLESMVILKGLEDGRMLELRRFVPPPYQLPTHLQSDDRVYVLVDGDREVRRFVFTTDATRAFEYVWEPGGSA